MSILLIPQKSYISHDGFIGINEQEARSTMTEFDKRILKEVAKIQTSNNIIQSFEAFYFSVPSNIKKEKLQNLEQIIAEWLKQCYLPKCSGMRTVFVDLNRGVVLSGKTVVYNRFYATMNVDEIKVKKTVDFVKELLNSIDEKNDEINPFGIISF